MYEIGHTLLGFSVTKALPIEEISCVYYELEHIASGAQVIHVAADDRENLFSLCFKTYPSSSNGVAHILEHTVLCGSTHFPVKDPFFSMTRRSLNTFMNAMTGADFTCYPAASQLKKDFYNLLDVYIDACFFPKLTKESFLQEGHRLEFEDPSDPTSPLKYKGIVFNEMKGAMSNIDSRMWQAVSKHLTPDLTYAYNSGGDPAVIPQLTYEELLNFHKTYYAPSRCIFFFYGDIPLETHLEYIEKKVLQSAEKLPPLPPLPKQPRFQSPQTMQEHFPIDGEKIEGKGMLAFSWLTTEIGNQEHLLALQILDSILMETDASPLRRALLESRLCTQADGLLDTEMSEIPYLIVCKGTDAKNTEQIRSLLMSNLAEIAKTGIPPEMIEAAIHQLEFQRSEITGDYGPFGLTLFFRSALAKQHGASPEDSLMIHKLFQAILLKANDPSYFPNLVKKYFLDNPHFVTVEMIPDPSCAEREKSEEKIRLQQIEKGLSDKEKEEIVLQAKQLEAFQEREEPLDCLPKLNKNDIPKEPIQFHLEEQKYGATTLFHHDTFTNHIYYLDVLFDMPEIPLEDLPYLQLLISLLPELGTQGHTFAENLHRTNLYTGGISTTISLFEQSGVQGTSRPAFIVRGKALKRNVQTLITLIGEYAFSARFDELERIRELILQIHTYLEQRLSKNPMSYALQMAHAPFSSHATLRNRFSGLPYVLFIREIAQNLDTSLPHIARKLQHLYENLTKAGRRDLVISADIDQYQENIDLLLSTFRQEEPGKTPLWNINYPKAEPISSIKTISSPVAFTAQAFSTILGTDPDGPALSLASSIFDNTTLHKRIREQGGAYGSGASYNPNSGAFHFYSYRDPHIKKTLAAFEEALQKGAKGRFTADDIEEALFSLIQNYDSPCAPGSRAMTAYSHIRCNRTLEMRKKYRARLLSATKDDIARAVQTHLLPAHQMAVTISLCGESLAASENVLPYSPT